jgi:hypothetical protein
LAPLPKTKKKNIVITLNKTKQNSILIFPFLFFHILVIWTTMTIRRNRSIGGSTNRAAMKKKKEKGN